MRPIISVTTLICMLTPVAAAVLAHASGTLAPRVGTLACRIAPQTGLQLRIHSTREIRCVFTPASGKPVEYYKGETGIEFGIDVNVDKQTRLTYAVRASRFVPGSGQLAGKYSGVGGSAAFGLKLGNAAPIDKQDGSASLQPVADRSSGTGFAAGFTYIYLEPDTSPKHKSY